MGDPRFPRRRYDTPTHPWQAARIEAENEVIRKYGLKNKREVWKAQSTVRRFRRQARNLQALQFTNDPQVALESRQLLARLQRLGLLGEDAKLEDVLALSLEAVLARRLATLAYHKGLAHSCRHARQLIVHNHVLVGGRVVNVPSYLVSRAEEPTIQYATHSPLTNEAHPMRPKPRAAEPAEGEAGAAEEAKEEGPRGRRPRRAARAHGAALAEPEPAAAEPAPEPEATPAKPERKPEPAEPGASPAETPESAKEGE